MRLGGKRIKRVDEEQDLIPNRRNTAEPEQIRQLAQQLREQFAWRRPPTASSASGLDDFAVDPFDLVEIQRASIRDFYAGAGTIPFRQVL